MGTSRPKGIKHYVSRVLFHKIMNVQMVKIMLVINVNYICSKSLENETGGVDIH